MRKNGTVSSKCVCVCVCRGCAAEKLIFLPPSFATEECSIIFRNSIPFQWTCINVILKSAFSVSPFFFFLQNIPVCFECSDNLLRQSKSREFQFPNHADFCIMPSTWFREDLIIFKTAQQQNSSRVAPELEGEKLYQNVRTWKSSCKNMNRFSMQLCTLLSACLYVRFPLIGGKKCKRSSEPVDVLWTRDPLIGRFSEFI